MITIEANVPLKVEVAVPPCQEFTGTQTAYLAQFARKLRSFYAKQTQFRKSQNLPNILWKQGL